MKTITSYDALNAYLDKIPRDITAKMLASSKVGEEVINGISDMFQAIGKYGKVSAKFSRKDRTITIKINNETKTFK